MSANTIDCSDVQAIVTAFSPGSPQCRAGLDACIRGYGKFKFEEGELSGIRRAIEILKSNSLPQACFRLAEILHDHDTE